MALADRNKLRKLVADDNADRNSLYREIASANGHPDWEADIRSTFAERWIANARAGWYYKSKAGRLDAEVRPTRRRGDQLGSLVLRGVDLRG